jgi:hypothetical protein
MPSTIEFPFSDDEALPTVPITLSHAGFSISANALLDTGSLKSLASNKPRCRSPQFYPRFRLQLAAEYRTHRVLALMERAIEGR